MGRKNAYVRPLRLGVIDAVIVAVSYLILGILGLVLSGTVGGTDSAMGFAGMAAGGGFTILIGGVVLGGIGGFILGVVTGVMYNFFARVVGGIIFELRGS
jgi:hypothetical protein